MTVPPNYSMPPEQPPTPGYGFQPQYGGPPRPEEPKRNYALIGAIVVGCTVLALGSVLLVAFMVNRDDGGEGGEVVAGDSTEPSAEETTAPAEEKTTTPADEETTPATDGSEEIGQCLPYEPQIADNGTADGLELLPSCDDAEAFWKITNMSYDIDAAVDSEGYLEDTQVAYDLCGDTYGYLYPGEVWTNWHWVYSSGKLDSLYCIEALGNPDDQGRTPVTPDTGDCFDESDHWWTVPCDSDMAMYEVVGSIVLDEPKVLNDDEAVDAATCGGEWYWELTTVDDVTTALLCGNEV